MLKQDSLAVAESGRDVDDRLQNRVRVCRRGGDHAQHIGGRRLLLQGIVQLKVALLQLLEESGVLDGDGRLVGEGF